MLKKGTKAGCVLCCGAFVLSSLLSLSGNLELCMVGKIIGGVSQSLLYSGFETYFVYSLSASSRSRSALIPDQEKGVSASLGVSFLGYSIPVVVSIVCATGGARYIHTRWENIPVAEVHLKSLVGWSAFREFAQNPSNLAVLIVQVGMESSVATITLLWSPVSYLVSTDGKPPYGVMFSTLMMTSLFGCLLYSRLRHRHSNAEILFAGAGIALIALWSITTICLHCIQVEWMFFAALNLYALSCGLYFPAMSNLKAYLYPDKYRAAMMSAVRVPLNIMIFLLVLVCHNPEDAFKWCFYLVLSSLAASYFLSSRVLEGKKFALPA
ncbi:Molybdate-anion transporter [Kappamyces sp. JEL0680]|nr:Molybdate-anion transporter [Kappamyces sp. JEL0680]